jgi:serine/threonine protein kinase
MPESDTVTGPDRSVPATVGWDAASVNRDFSVAPFFDLLALPTQADVSTPPDGAGGHAPTINGYRILEIIGRGGMGTVYKAQHLELNRIVALKLVHPGGRDDSTMRLRFEREFRSLASIEHPNIVPVYDAGNWQGFPYFTMKYIPPGPLSEHLGRFRADPVAAVKMVAKVARAVHHLHEAGVLHRDLKPLNILICDSDEPLVADFGLAKWLNDDTDLSMTGVPMGTRQYMSPEQSHGKKCDYAPASDVWALGIILFEVLTGERPFGSDDPVELYMQIRSADPPPLESVNPALPPGLNSIVRLCLTKQPALRYQSAAQVADDLERWLNGDAFTETQFPGRWKPPRRWLVPAATLFVLLIIAGAMIWFRNSGQNAQARALEPSPSLPVTQSLLAPPEGWEDLLAREPVERLWPVNGRNDQKLYDANNLSLSVACDDWGLLSLGTAATNEYSLAVTMQQHPWSGNAGLFLGYQSTPGAAVPQLRYQVIELVMEEIGDQGIRHRLDWKSVLHEGPVGRQRQVINHLGRSVSFTVSRGEHRMKVTVGKKGLESVSWDDQVLPGLHAEGNVRRPAPVSYSGEFGIHVFAGNGVFREAHFTEAKK